MPSLDVFALVDAGALLVRDSILHSACAGSGAASYGAALASASSAHVSYTLSRQHDALHVVDSHEFQAGPTAANTLRLLNTTIVCDVPFRASAAHERMSGSVGVVAAADISVVCSRANLICEYAAHCVLVMPLRAHRQAPHTAPTDVVSAEEELPRCSEAAALLLAGCSRGRHRRGRDSLPRRRCPRNLRVSAPPLRLLHPCPRRLRLPKQQRRHWEGRELARDGARGRPRAPQQRRRARGCGRNR